MSTQAITGFGGSVTLSSSAVAEVGSWNGTINVETADTTALESSGFRNRIPTITDFTGTFESNVFLPLTSGAARAAVFAVGTAASATKPTITTRIIHSTGIEVPAEKVNFSYDFESDGPIVVAVA